MSVYTHVLYLVEDCLVVAGHVDHHGLLHTHLLSTVYLQQQQHCFTAFLAYSGMVI